MTVEEARAHSFFSLVDWQRMVEKVPPSPLPPSVSGGCGRGAPAAARRADEGVVVMGSHARALRTIGHL